MENKKMMKTAGTFETIFKVVRGITMACGFVCLAMAVLVLIFGEKMFVPGSLTLDLDFVKLHLAEEFQGITGAIKLYAVVSLLWAGVLLFVTAYTCGLYRGILALVKEGRPFEKGVVTNLRKVAWAILAGGAAATLLGLVGHVILTRAYPMEQIFASEAVTKLEYVFTMDFSFVATACIVFLLSYIFSYGQALQRQSDETL